MLPQGVGQIICATIFRDDPTALLLYSSSIEPQRAVRTWACVLTVKEAVRQPFSQTNVKPSN